MPDCVFCQIVTGDAPATIVREWPDAIAIIPLNPVVEGHTLVIPRYHQARASHSSQHTGLIAMHADQLAAEMGPDFHLIINNGPCAGQTVEHLHWHIVPRRPADRVVMPWDHPGYVRRLVESTTRHMETARHEAEVGRRLRGELAVAQQQAEQWRRTAVKLALTNGTAFYRLTTPEADALRSAIDQQREREAIAADVLAERTTDAASGQDGTP